MASATTVKLATKAEVSPSDASNGVLQLVSFPVGSGEFGVEILNQSTDLPRHVEGVVNPPRQK